MWKQGRSQRGQAVFSEYTMVIFIVIAAIVAITVYVQRSFEARIHDSRNYMIDSVSNVCDANCVMAAGGTITHEYEPYYTQLSASSQANQSQTQTAQQGSPSVIGAIYHNFMNQATTTNSTSVQLPAQCEDGTGVSPSC